MKPYKTYVVGKMLGKASLAILLTTGLRAEIPPAPAAPLMRDAATHEQLVSQFRIVDREDPMRNMKPSNQADPSKVHQPESLIRSSDILCFGGVAVLVPKRAILQLPSKLADRLKFIPGSPFVSWADFYAANRGWITTVEVTRTQAEGNLDLDKETHERITKSMNLIVATYLTGPISVLPLKVAEEKTTEQTKL